MSEKLSKNLIKAKTNEFLSNKHNTEALRILLDSFKVSYKWYILVNCHLKIHTFQEAKERHFPIISYLLSLEGIFVELLKAGDMKIDVVPLKVQGKLETKKVVKKL